MDFEVRSLGFEDPSEKDRLVFTRTRVVDGDFSGRRLSQFSSEGTRFENCRFDRTVFESASMGAGRLMSTYVGCSFESAKMDMVPGGYARFENCTFDGTTIRGWFCFSVELVDCTFSGTLRKVVFNGTVPELDRPDINREVNQFEGNDFSRATLIDVGFRTGIDLTRQRLPEGPEYAYLEDGVSALERARAALDTWEDEEAKRDAGSVLTVMERNLASGQRQLFVTVNGFPVKTRPAIRAMLQAATGA